MAIILAEEKERHPYAPGVWVEIPPLTREAVADLYEQAQGSDQRFHDLVSDHCINDFAGFIDKRGDAMPVNLESKNALRRNVRVGQWIEQRINGTISVEEAEIKNLQRSPGGGSTTAAGNTAETA